MEWIRLTKDEELVRFNEQAHRLWKVTYPIDYLRLGDVYASFAPNGDMNGGVALVYNTTLRTLSFFSPEARAASPVLSSVPESSFCEITGFFFDPKCSSPREVARAWRFLLKALRRTGKSHAVWGYNLAFEGLTRLYAQLGVTTLYAGPVSSSSVPSGSKVARGALVSVSIAKFHVYVNWMLIKRSFRSGVRGIYKLQDTSSATSAGQSHTRA